VTDSNTPLPFRRADLELLQVDDLSQQLCVSRAFVRLCISAGCPTRRGRLSSAELLHWLFENFEKVREHAGLCCLPGVDGLNPDVAHRLRMGLAVITLLEFGESRASSVQQKRELRRARLGIERALDGA
jgi:hypothetical protein